MSLEQIKDTIYIISDPAFFKNNNYPHRNYIHFRHDSMPIGYKGSIVRKPIIGDPFRIEFAYSYTDPTKQANAIKNTKTIIENSRSLNNSIIQTNIQVYEKFIKGPKLDADQRKVVNAKPDTHMRVCACAGSGKTTTILHRIRKLITDHKIPENKILLTTFSKDASVEMSRRLSQLLNIPKPGVTVHTLDALALSLISKYAPNMIRGRQLDVGEYKSILNSFLSRSPTTLKDIATRFKYIFIDEFQDVDDYQYCFIKMLSDNGSYITVIGDDGQNIYSFRGTNIKYILEFPSQFPNCIDTIIRYNYRSTPEIIAVANASINKNVHQIKKDMIPTKNSIGIKPEVRFYNNPFQASNSIMKSIRSHLAQGIPLHEMAILVRNGKSGSLKRMETVLTKNKINSVYVDHLSDVRSGLKPNHLALLTIHKSKGLEWKVVYLMDATDNYFPRDKSPVSIEEERRLFYVAVTRAKQYCYISFSNLKDQAVRVTRFVSELPRNLFAFHRSVQPSHLDKAGSTQIFQTSFKITDMIRNLQPKHFDALRALKIIDQFNPVVRKLYPSPHTYQPFIHAMDLYTDFGFFLEDFVSRGLGCIKNIAANEMIARVILTKDEMHIFNKYQNNFAYNIKFIKQNTRDFNMVLENIEGHHPVIRQEIKKITIEDTPFITSIVYKLLKNSKEFNIQPQFIPILAETTLPKEFIKEFEESYKKYTNPAYDNTDIIPDIFKVSWCNNIRGGRARLLYKKITPTQLESCTPLLNDIMKYYIKPTNEYIAKKSKSNSDSDPFVKSKITFEKGVVIGEADLIIGTTVIDVKVSYKDTLELSHILQLLSYAGLAREAGMTINKIAILNPLRGKLFTINIENWDKGTELITFLTKISMTTD